MKHITGIVAIATSLLFLQGCGPADKKTDEKTAAEAVPREESTQNSRERHEKLLQERTRKMELRKIEMEKEASVTPYYTDADGFIVFNKAEVEPHYKGGAEALNQYLSEHINYPEVAKTAGLEGTIIVNFVVAANGNIRQVHVDESTDGDAGQSLRTEAIRLVSSMPAWEPGSQRGKAVDVKFSVPITFQLD